MHNWVLDTSLVGIHLDREPLWKETFEIKIVLLFNARVAASPEEAPAVCVPRFQLLGSC